MLKGLNSVSRPSLRPITVNLSQNAAPLYAFLNTICNFPNYKTFLLSFCLYFITFDFCTGTSESYNLFLPTRIPLPSRGKIRITAPNYFSVILLQQKQTREKKVNWNSKDSQSPNRTNVISYLSYVPHM